MALFKLETKFVVVDALPAADSCPLQPGDIGLVHIPNPIGPDHKGIDRKVVIVEDDFTPKVDRSRQVIVRFLDEPDGYEHLFHRWRILPNKEPTPVKGLQIVWGKNLPIHFWNAFLSFTRDEQHAMALQLHFRDAGSRSAGMGRRFWVFRDRIYSTTDLFTPEEMTALIVDAENRKKAKIERALNKAVQRSPGSSERRQPIPDEVKILVWQRDCGCCVKCACNRNLEFDHIIPLALGGSNTARNLQLLCEDCNRAKGASLV